MSRWAILKSPSSASSAPTISACYVIRVDGHVYIGSTSNLRKRLTQYRLRHDYGNGYLTPWGACKTISIKYRPSVKYGDWVMVEMRLIRRLRPSLNITGWKSGRIGSAAKARRVERVPVVMVKLNRYKEPQEVFATVADFIAGVTLRDAMVDAE